jgi:FkbM family methyltransferase
MPTVTSEERAAIYPALQVESPIVVNLGAYCGEDEPDFRALAQPNELKLIMVEPDPRNIEIIEKKPLSENRQLIKGAIAECSCYRDFRFSYDSRDGSRGSGSLMKPTGHLKHFPTISFSEPEIVRCYTLDEIFLDSRLSKIDLLWVDIQGAERHMIEGGIWTLLFTRYCFMEAEEIELYKGQALKAELIELMKGYTLIADFGYNILLKNERFRMLER